MGFQNVAIGRINSVATLVGFYFKKTYGDFTGTKAALQAATILVAMASGNKIWRLNFPHRSPIWRPV